MLLKIIADNYLNSSTVFDINCRTKEKYVKTVHLKFYFTFKLP